LDLPKSDLKLQEDGGTLMTEQTMTKERMPQNKTTIILRKIVQWSILALLLFTCIMAAYRKFGG
jgi:hypothetical protein